MIIFFLQMVYLAWKDTLADWGTSGLGWILLFAIPVTIVLTKSWHVPKGKKLAIIRSEWIGELRNTFLVTLFFTIIIFLFELLIAQPRHIINTAANIKPPVFTWHPPSAPVINKEVSTTATKNDLKKQTNKLASDIFYFVYRREGPISAWKQQAIAQAFLSAMSNKNEGDVQFRERLKMYNDETLKLFIESYLNPRVIPIIRELVTAGVDISPVIKAAQTDNPRNIALMLSVVAERIGKHPPYQRVLTPLEATAIIEGYGAVTFEIYADLKDQNARQIAETLRAAFQSQKSPINKYVLPLEAKKTPLYGIHIILPSPDLEFNFEGMIQTFIACDLDTTVEIRPMKQPPSIFKIEVWPAKPLAIDFPNNQLIEK
jgi:hypothetical protein